MQLGIRFFIICPAKRHRPELLLGPKECFLAPAIEMVRNNFAKGETLLKCKIGVPAESLKWIPNRKVEDQILASPCFIRDLKTVYPAFAIG